MFKFEFEKINTLPNIILSTSLSFTVTTINSYGRLLLIIANVVCSYAFKNSASYLVIANTLPSCVFKSIDGFLVLRNLCLPGI